MLICFLSVLLTKKYRPAIGIAVIILPCIFIVIGHLQNKNRELR